MALNPDFLSSDEQVIRVFRPHWRMLILPIAWLVVGILGIILVYQLPPENTMADLIATGLILVALVPLSFKRLIGWWFTPYVLTNERLVVRAGSVARSGIEIPLENINNVLFEQSVLERILRCGDLLIESAGETGQSRLVDIRQPDQFQALLYRTREARSKDMSGASSRSEVHPTEHLERLAQLHRDGVLSDEEFEEKKRSLLEKF